MENLDFLKTKYHLHTSPEIEKAVKRTEKRTGEKVPQKPEARLENYLNRFKEIVERKNPDKREQGISALKRLLHSKFVIKPEEIPEATFLLEQRIARELGHGDVEITDEFKEQKTGQIINNQIKSLDKWVDYLASPDAQYPDWAKYWTLRSVLEMGKLQKELDEKGRETANFQKREKNTVASFPLLNPRALALTIGALSSLLEEKAKPKKERKLVENKSLKLDDKEFKNLLQTEKFSKIYAQFLIEMPEYSTEGLEEIRGKWVKYNKGSQANELVKSLEGYPLEWCTADYDTAQTQLQGGDFYVYYSINQSGEAIIPRLAIRLQDDKIAEARGIAPDQNLDPYIAPVLEEKLKEFGPEGEAYKKKSADMKLLTEIENKVKAKQPLSKDELIFLYEINSPIEGFGYEKDPRIEEIRQTRNSKEDVPIVFECRPEQIAYTPEDVDENTKAYIGEWDIKIFQKIRNYPNITHLYESFMGEKIFMQTLETNPNINSPESAEEAMKRKNIYSSDWGDDILLKTEFSKEAQKYGLVRFTVGQLGFPNGATTDEIYKKAEDLGLELCPAEVGPQLRLQYPGKEGVLIAMKQIADRFGNPRVFGLYSNIARLGLRGSNAEPSFWWPSDVRLVFRFRKPPRQS